MSKPIKKVRTSVNEGANKGANRELDIRTLKKAHYSRNLENSDVWLSVSEGANILGVTVRAVQQACKKVLDGKNKKYIVRVDVGNGGEQYKILLSSLPVEAQQRYWANSLEVEVVEPAPMSASEAEIEAEIYSRAPQWARDKADKYLNILKATEGMKRSELQNFVAVWNQKRPDFKTSYQSVYRMRKIYEEQGVSGLLAGYGKRAGESTVNDDWFEYFKSQYLVEGGPSLRSCWIYTLGYAQRQNAEISPDTFPSPAAFDRRLKREIPESSICLAREGYMKYNRKFAPYIDRDYTDVKAGSVWVSDHAQVDVAVLMPNGKICFPWVTAWRCFKTSKWLGWNLHMESPNSDHIFMAFYHGALNVGIPEHLYIDNGKDYRSKDFAGGRKHVKVLVDEGKTTAMVAQLGITPHFSLPYGAQSKPIERDFLKNKTYLSKHMVGYRGGNVVERPEKLQDEIKKGLIMPFEEFAKVFETFVVNVLNRMPSEGKNLKGLSPDQLWAREFVERREVSRDALKLFCTRASGVISIGRDGVRDSLLKVTYWDGSWMSGQKGRKVYLRRDVLDFAEAWVFDAETDEYLGKGRINEFSSPALADTAVSRRQLSEAMANKKRDMKITKAYIQTREKPDAMEQMIHLQTGTDALASLNIDPVTGEMLPTTANPTVTRMANTKMDKVVRQEREDATRGTYDLSKLVGGYERPKPLFLFESDKKQAEEDERRKQEEQEDGE